MTKFVKDDEKSVISRRMAREPPAAHPAPVPRPRARSSQEGGGMWRDAPVGAGMTILWLSCFMADDFSGYFGDVQIHPLISIVSLDFFRVLI